MSSDDGPPLLRPIPRRPFDLNLTGPTPPEEESLPPSPERNSGLNLESLNSRLLDPRNRSESTSISRAQSIMNLTSSTLYGIYSPTASGAGGRDRYYGGEHDEPSTPWGTGAETPAKTLDVNDPYFEISKGRAQMLKRRPSTHPAPRPLSTPATILHLGLRAALLFGLGMLYGMLVARIQDGQNFAASLQMEDVLPAMAAGYDWRYLAFWGVLGVVLGGLLPWFDGVWEGQFGQDVVEPDDVPEKSLGGGEQAEKESQEGTDWALVMRGIGAFVGIVYAIRKLPWASTLQVSLSLALVNPFLWYLIDRSKPGFLLSAAVGLTGSAILLGLKADVVPTPSGHSFGLYGSQGRNTSGSNLGDPSSEASPMLLGGLASQETLETGIWMLSVLFCCCVCFGNIGRRLALNRSGAAKGRWAGLR